MEKYDFLIGGVPIAVYPVSEPASDGIIKRDGLSVILYTDSLADYGIVAFDKDNNEPREPTLILAALFCFFTLVRGYPKMTLHIKYKDKLHEIAVGEKASEYSIELAKSKILFTKKLKYSDGIEIQAHIFKRDGYIAAIVCRDAETFDLERMKVALSQLGAQAVIVASYDDDVHVRTVGRVCFYDAVSVAVTALCYEGVRIREGHFAALVDEFSYSLVNTDSDIIISPDIKYLY